jgi:hypothetical protein
MEAKEEKVKEILEQTKLDEKSNRDITEDKRKNNEEVVSIGNFKRIKEILASSGSLKYPIHDMIYHRIAVAPMIVKNHFFLLEC